MGYFPRGQMQISLALAVACLSVIAPRSTAYPGNYVGQRNACWVQEVRLCRMFFSHGLSSRCTHQTFPAGQQSESAQSGKPLCKPHSRTPCPPNPRPPSAGWQCLLCDIFPRSCDFLLIPSPPLLHPICILPTFPLRPMQGWSWAGLTSLGVAPACASGFDHCLHRRLPFTASFPAEATGSPCRAQQSVLSLSLSPSLHRRSTLDLVCLTPQFPRSTWYYHPTLSSPL